VQQPPYGQPQGQPGPNPYGQANAAWTPPGGVPPQPPKKKSHAGLIVAVVAIVLVLIVVGGAAMWLSQGRSTTKTAVTTSLLCLLELEPDSHLAVLGDQCFQERHQVLAGDRPIAGLDPGEVNPLAQTIAQPVSVAQLVRKTQLELPGQRPIQVRGHEPEYPAGRRPPLRQPDCRFWVHRNTTSPESVGAWE